MASLRRVTTTLMTTRHEFLAQLHALVRPITYMEIGVQYGTGLMLAHDATTAIGIDPSPQMSPVPENTVLHSMTSDDYFASIDPKAFKPAVDLAFIDGMHWYEFALRDFFNIEKISHKNTIVVFDDVLPRNQEEATRAWNTFDWTGDVWKVYPILKKIRPDLTMVLVDTQPTGALLVWNLKPKRRLPNAWTEWPDETVPDNMINRTHAVTPERAIEFLTSAISFA